MSTAVGIPYKTEAGKDLLLCTSAHGVFFFLSIWYGLVKGLYVFLQLCVWGRRVRMAVPLVSVSWGIGLPKQIGSIWGKCCFCCSLISEVELLLTYFETRQH